MVGDNGDKTTTKLSHTVATESEEELFLHFFFSGNQSLSNMTCLYVKNCDVSCFHVDHGSS